MFYLIIIKHILEKDYRRDVSVTHSPLQGRTDQAAITGAQTNRGFSRVSACTDGGRRTGRGGRSCSGLNIQINFFRNIWK